MVTEPMKVVVLGGSGFLGSHVADQLTHAGHQVYIYDRAPSPWLQPGQHMIVGDVMDRDGLAAAIAGAGAVFHFAALADLDQLRFQPVETIQTNVLGTVFALEACRLHRVPRFLYASTVYVHSREGGFYRCSKQAAEQYVEEYERTYGVDYTILRFGSLYGPRSTASNSLYQVVRRALETGQIVYQGSPEALREYIHVDDAARASVTALGEAFRNESIVLTGQGAMRVYDLLQMLAEILNLPDSVTFSENNYPGHYIRTPYASQSKLGRKYLPPLHVDLGQGLLQLIEDIRRSLP
jgi:UDP-glucose 4-epimerase